MENDDTSGAIERMHEILVECDMPLYPDAAKQAGVCYTDFLTGAHEHKFATDPKSGENYIYTPKRNRQCSIGWHGECTDPSGEKCGCPCHKIAALLSESRRAALEDAAQAADLLLGATMAQSSVGKAIRALAKGDPNV